MFVVIGVFQDLPQSEFHEITFSSARSSSFDLTALSSLIGAIYTVIDIDLFLSSLSLFDFFFLPPFLVASWMCL